MEFLRPILLILFLMCLSLAGFVGLENVFPDSFAVDSGRYDDYIVSGIFYLLFIARIRNKKALQWNDNRRIPDAVRLARENMPKKDMHEVRKRIKDRKSAGG